MRLTTLITICMGCWAMADEGSAGSTVAGDVTPPLSTFKRSNTSNQGEDVEAAFEAQDEEIEIICKFGKNDIKVQFHTPGSFEEIKKEDTTQLLLCPQMEAANYLKELKKQFKNLRTDKPASIPIQTSITFDKNNPNGYIYGSKCIFALSDKNNAESSKSFLKFGIIFGNPKLNQMPIITDICVDWDTLKSLTKDENTTEIKNWTLCFALIAKQYQSYFKTGDSTRENLTEIMKQITEVLGKLSENQKSSKPKIAASLTGLSQALNASADKMIANTGFITATSTNFGKATAGIKTGLSGLSDVQSWRSPFSSWGSSKS